MKRVLLILGLGLLGGAGVALAQHDAPALQPVRAAPEPLPPQLQAAGLPGLPELPSTGPPADPQFRQLAPRQPPVPKEPTAERPPAFRPVTPHGQQSSSLRSSSLTEQHVAPVNSAAAQTPTLTLDKSGPASVVPGQPFSYEIVVRNVGSVAALGARLEDELAPATRVTAALPTPQLQPGRVTWVIDNLPPGQEQRFRVEAVAGTATAWGGGASLTVTASRAFRPRREEPAQGALRLELSAPAMAYVGAPVTFQMRVTNAGSTPLSRVVLHDRLPPGLDHFMGGDIETSLESLRPGESQTLKLEVVAALPGRHANQVLARAEGGKLATAQAEVTVTEDPHLAVRLLGPKEPLAEREAEYRIEVTNRGPATRGVQVACQLPEGVAIVSGIADGSYDPATRTARWALGALEPGQARSLPIRLLARTTSAVVQRVTARTQEGHEARLHTVLRFRAVGGGR
ncbi:MAG: hypothetical protein L0Z62_34315 [Gemmataceae bacterium]|nr:hypothetical protein [Gemmataceae bacterium]